MGTKEELARGELTADRTNWLVDPPRGAAALPGQDPLQRPAGRRPRSRRSPATACAVAFDEPQYGVAPGQAVVCYDGRAVLGGGWIE